MPIYRKAANIVASEVAGETLLVPIRDRLADMKHIFALDDVPAFIWSRIDGARTCADIAAELIAEFDVSAQQANDDLQAFMDDLESAGLIVSA